VPHPFAFFLAKGWESTTLAGQKQQKCLSPAKFFFPHKLHPGVFPQRSPSPLSGIFDPQLRVFKSRKNGKSRPATGQLFPQGE
jgi:hypothetical protein